MELMIKSKDGKTTATSDFRDIDGIAEVESFLFHIQLAEKILLPILAEMKRHDE